MSRIYFHGEHKTVGVSGVERAWAGWLCNDLLQTALGVTEFNNEDDPIRKMLPADYFSCYSGKQFVAMLGTWCMTDEGSRMFRVGEQTVSPWVAALNTAWVMGSDPVKLLARLHAQCELHCYVEEPNRGWLAEIVEQGQQTGLLRHDSGWGGVVTLLRSQHPGPVVTSFSVCESFPNAGLVAKAGLWSFPENEAGESDWDAWYTVPEAEQWRLGLAALRGQGGGLELRPDKWQGFRFGSGLTGFDVRQYANSLFFSRQATPRPPAPQPGEIVKGW